MCGNSPDSMNNESCSVALKASALDFERPWPGLLSFTETGNAFFFGRNQEIAELHRRVKNHTLTTLFGQSGYGKTSLVLAGLFPTLRAGRFKPIRIRPDYESELSVVDQIKQHVAREFDGSADTKASLWECFHRIGNPLCSGQDGRTPCLVFDQFEEIFTAGYKSDASRQQVDAFLQELSCLVENTVPPGLETELERNPESAEGFEFARQGYRVVIVLREDYLADFEELKRRMPAIMQNRMRLGRLTRAQALEAIRGPASRAPHPLIRLEVARSIVDFVMGQPAAETGSPSTKCVELIPAIDPALLNLLCRELNEKRLEAGEIEITEDLVKSGQQTAILTDFYERQLRNEPKAVRRLIEDELVTGLGHRESMSLEQATSKLEKAGVSPDSLERLVRGRLLRISDRLDRKRVEVAHDILTGVIRKSRQTRELEDAKRRAEAEKKRADKQQRLAVMRRRRAAVLFLGGFLIAAFFCYSFYRQAEMQRALAAEESEKLTKERQQSEQARNRSQALLHLAERHLALENDPKKEVLALYYLSRALRFDRGNGAATSRTCELLSQRAWCPALSPVLQFNSESALLCATWDPNGNLIVVSKDGQFLRWNGTGHELRPAGSALSQPVLATSAEAAPPLMYAEPAKFSSGFFSRDGQHLLLFSMPPPSRATTAQIRGWSQATGSYDSILQTIEIKDSAQFRRVAWSHDGKILVIVSGGWDHSACQVFRHNGELYQEIANPFGNTKVAAACFSEDDKWLATESPEGAVQLWDPATLTSGAEPAQGPGSFGLPSNVHPRSLAFGPGKDELVTVLFDGSISILDLRSGSTRSGYARDKQVMCFAFSPQQAKRRLAAAVLRGSIVLSKPETLDQPIAEPICFQGAFCSAIFSSDGTKLLTVSGPFWDASDTVRVWDVSLQEPLPASVTLPPDSTLVPPWLAELGQVVSAQWRNLDDEDVPASLDALAQKYSPKEVDGPYAAIWNRFFSSPNLSSSPLLGREEKTRFGL
jgi:WD40 repeat protein